MRGTDEFDVGKWMESRKTMVAAHADKAAEKTAEFLHDWFRSLGYATRIAMPKSFLLELAAILCIAEWQGNNCLRELGDEFPGAVELWDDLILCFMDNAGDFENTRKVRATKLSAKCLSAYTRHCATSAIQDLGVDFVVKGPSDDALLDLLADLLWQNRHLSQTTREVQYA